MDLDLGYLSKGLTKRSILGQCGGSLSSSESDVDDYAMNMVNDFTTNKVRTPPPCTKCLAPHHAIKNGLSSWNTAQRGIGPIRCQEDNPGGSGVCCLPRRPTGLSKNYLKICLSSHWRLEQVLLANPTTFGKGKTLIVLCEGGFHLTTLKTYENLRKNDRSEKLSLKIDGFGRTHSDEASEIYDTHLLCL